MYGSETRAGGTTRGHCHRGIANRTPSPLTVAGQRLTQGCRRLSRAARNHRLQGVPEDAIHPSFLPGLA